MKIGDKNESIKGFKTDTKLPADGCIALFVYCIILGQSMNNE